MDTYVVAPGRSPRRGSSSEHAVFFALPLDPETRALVVRQWVDLCARFGLRASPVPAQNLHLSLLGIAADDAPPARWLLDLLGAAAAKVPSAPFEIELDRVLSFDRNGPHKPLVLAETRRTEALTILHDRLREALAAEGLHLRGSLRTPHVTMSYDLPLPDALAIPPIRLEVNEFCLIHSHRGMSRHEVLGRWPLRGWS